MDWKIYLSGEIHSNWREEIIEITKTNYRLLLGPFNDIQSLKDSFEKMNSLYFENLEIIKDA